MRVFLDKASAPAGVSRKYQKLYDQARRIKFLYTDCDGVLTDNGVYYSGTGEEFKRFSVRDGLGVARLRLLAGVETGIITGENSLAVKRRAEKLKIAELHLGVQNKTQVLHDLLQAANLTGESIAYIGDDVNDLEIMQAAGLSACPADAMPSVKKRADYLCKARGGHGAFREFAELIIAAKMHRAHASKQ